jgi:hypothetical protein
MTKLLILANQRAFSDSGVARLLPAFKTAKARSPGCDGNFSRAARAVRSGGLSVETVSVVGSLETQVSPVTGGAAAFNA